MKQIKKTIWCLFTNDVKSLFFLIYFLVFYIPFQAYNLAKKFDEINIDVNNTMLFYFFSIAFGIFISLGINKLMNTYVWKTNRNYKIHLFKAVFLCSVVFSLFLILIYSPDSFLITILYLAISISVIMFMAFAKGNGLSFVNFFVFTIPILTLFREKLVVSDNLFFTLVIFHIFLMIISVFYTFKKKRFDIEKIDKDNSKPEFCGDNLNNKISAFIPKLKSFQQGKIDYAIKSPFAITGLTGMLFFVLIAALELFLKTEPSVLLVLANVTIAIMSLSIAINARRLMPETAKIAHVFTGMKHKQFKNKLLSSLDKSILFNSFTFLSLLLLVLAILPISFDLKYLAISSFAILIFSLSFYPIIICLTGKKFVRLVPLVTYVLVIIYIIFQLFTRGINMIPSEAIILFTVLCLGCRVLAQMLLWNTNYEDLVNTDEWEGF